MTQNKLERIVDAAGRTISATMTTAVAAAALTATVGALGAGIYEGYTGQKIFGSETPASIRAVEIAYVTPIIAVIGDKIIRGGNNDEALLGALMCPIGPAISLALYGMGYGIGKIFQ